MNITCRNTNVTSDYTIMGFLTSLYLYSAFPALQFNSHVGIRVKISISYTLMFVIPFGKTDYLNSTIFVLLLG